MPLLTDSEWNEYTKYLVDNERFQTSYDNKIKELVGDELFKIYKRGTVIESFLSEETRKEYKKLFKESMIAMPQISENIETYGKLITDFLKQDILQSSKFENLPPSLHKLYGPPEEFESTDMYGNRSKYMAHRKRKEGGKRKTRGQRKTRGKRKTRGQRKQSRRFRRSK